MIMNTKIKLYAYHYLTRNDEFKRIWGHDFNMFKEQLKEIAKQYKPINICNLHDLLDGKKTNIPEKCIILTFDDGLKEHSQTIGPYLEKIGIRGIFFVPSCILHGQPAISQIIPFGTAYYGIRKFYELIEKYLLIHLQNPHKYLITYPDKLDIYHIHSRIKRIFRVELSHEKSYEILLSFWNSELKKDVPGVFEKVYMSKDDMRNLVKAGHSIGVHTNTHPTINDSTYSEHQFIDEIETPKNELEKVIGEKIKYFAYPYGHENYVYYEKEQIQKVRNLGIEFLFTTFQKDEYFDKNFVGRHLVYSNFDKLIDKKGSEQLLHNQDWYYEIIK